MLTKIKSFYNIQGRLGKYDFWRIQIIFDIMLILICGLYFYGIFCYPISYGRTICPIAHTLFGLYIIGFSGYITASVRRLHDINASGKRFFIYLYLIGGCIALNLSGTTFKNAPLLYLFIELSVTVILPIYFICLKAQNGKRAMNPYGTALLETPEKIKKANIIIALDILLFVLRTIALAIITYMMILGAYWHN